MGYNSVFRGRVKLATKALAVRTAKCKKWDREGCGRQSPEINSKFREYFPIAGKRTLGKSINSSGKQKEKLMIWKLHIKYLIPSSRGICTIPSQFQSKLPLPLWDSVSQSGTVQYLHTSADPTLSVADLVQKDSQDPADRAQVRKQEFISEINFLVFL